MATLCYLGDGGQYGPFTMQADGWPDAGQVMRYFREKHGLTAKELGKLYGKEVGKQGKPVCERWILEMELENKVPTDITRRRVIARLLHIPPALFGLASLEDLSIHPQKKRQGISSTLDKSTFQQLSTDIAPYERSVRLRLHLHRTSNAQSLLQDINADIENLSAIDGQTKGDLACRARELLIGNNLIATKIVKDQRMYADAFSYANNAVRIAKSLEDEELIAATRYTRGCVKLEWGLYGSVQQGQFQVDSNKIEKASYEFQALLENNIRTMTLHPQLQGFIMLQLSRAQSMLKRGQSRSSLANILIPADQAANMVGRNSIDDIYTRMITTGTVSGLHPGGYYLIKAGIFNIAGLSGKAFAELNKLKSLTEKTYGKDETRNQAWINVAFAETLIGLGEYTEAICHVKEALVACHNINSTQNIMSIIDIYGKLAPGKYGLSTDVKELEDMLKEWYEIELKRS